MIYTMVRTEEWPRKKLKHHCLGLASLERTIALFRSQVLYLDANSSFFHQQARFREKNNSTIKLQVGDQINLVT
jgi:hypothetical protein